MIRIPSDLVVAIAMPPNVAVVVSKASLWRCVAVIKKVPLRVKVFTEAIRVFLLPRISGLAIGTNDARVTV